jgi:signal transduction histidine kinase
MPCARSWLDHLTVPKVIPVLLAFLTFLTLQVRAAEPQRNVLVLFSNEYELPANQLIARGFRDELVNSSGFRTFTEFLDLVRFPKQIEDGSLLHQLHEKYAGQKIDALMTFGEEALGFAKAERNSIAPSAPLVFAAVSEDDPRVAKLENTTGLISHYDILTTLKLATRLQPEARDIFVITGASAADRAVEERARSELPALGPDFRFHFLAGLPVDTMLKEVASLNRNAIVFYYSMYEDANGVMFIPRDAARMIAQASAAPVYGVYDSYLGTGIVGGYFDRFEAVGREAAKLALRVLNGENAATIPPYVADTHRFVVDGSVIESRSLDMNALPEGTIIQNWQPPLWRQYFWLLIAVAVAFAAETLLVLWLYLAVRRQHLAERAAAEHQRQMEVQRAELAHLSRISALGSLSGSIAHELNQPLTAILANAQAALAILGRKGKNLDVIDETLRDIVEDTKRAGQVISNIRSLVKRDDAKKIDVDINNVVTDTLKLAHSAIIQEKVQVKADLASHLPKVVGDPTQFQQVILNLVLNACEAMEQVPEEARKINIATVVADGQVRLVLADSGPGFPSEGNGIFEPFYTTKTDGLGLGLSICRDIINGCGGTIGACNKPGGGAALTIELPAAPEMSA